MSALEGLRVLDLSRVLAGPWASQMLADLGAEVIKVERPGRGDDTRGWGPPFLAAGEQGQEGDAAYFAACNRGKRSVAIDFSQPAGRDLVGRLAAQSDVLIENFKVGALRKYALDYESLSSRHPGLVYCSITGFGQTGPYRHRPGYDFLIQAMGGLMSLTGEADGRPGGGPQKTGVALADVMTGLYAGNAIMAALIARGRSGRGQHIDLALLDVQVATLANQAMNYLVTGQAPERLGNAHPSIVPYQAVPTADGHMILAIGNDGQFAKFCQLAGCAELAEDPRYAGNAGRVRHREQLMPLIERCTRQRETAEWVHSLEAAGVPCGPINTLDGVFADPQVRARQMALQLPTGPGTAHPAVANPIRLSGTPVEYGAGAPRLGEHTAAVLSERLGLAPQALDALAAEGIIALG